MMQLEVPLTLIRSPLRAGRGEQESTRFKSLVGELDTVHPNSFTDQRVRARRTPAEAAALPIHFNYIVPA